MILDEYTKNRDVWRCPSARTADSYGINPCNTGDWLKYPLDNIDNCNSDTAPGIWPCGRPYPAGWGGSVTDSGAQGMCAGATSKGFDRSIGNFGYIYDVKLASIGDTVKYVVCSDAGAEGGGDFVWCTSLIAYPDVCRINHVADDPTCGRDWANCPDTVACSAGIGVWQIGTDPEYRKAWAKARHLGGSNVGFADGHAAWIPSEKILFDGINVSGYGNGPDMIENVDCMIVTERGY